MVNEFDDNLTNGIIEKGGNNENLLREAEEFYAQSKRLAETMFGYPSYNAKLSALTQHLLLLHYNSPFSNNCGDINEHGNYKMDTKQTEKKIVGLFADKFGMGDNFWGYVTSGGTESNTCGIMMAFNRYPDGVLYYSEAAHYSVKKAGKVYRHREIPTLGRDVLDTDKLFEAIKENFEKDGSPANVVLTYGTTLYGECDDFDKVVAFLKSNDIPYFLHLDAALFGGIPSNQTGAPILTDLKKRGVHSTCVSMHKYLGFPDVHSVFVATDHPWVSTVDYIGQHDTTVSGSRSIPAFALYNHLKEQLGEKDTGAYFRNVTFFEKALKEAGVKFYRAEKANIFVVDCPEDEVCKKYQLSTFYTVENGKKAKKAHIIIFPHHGNKEMSQLINALKIR